MFTIQPFIGETANMLPPNKSARPSVSFKEYSAEHLHETIYFPGKVEWSTLEVSLYDVKCSDNPIFNWMRAIYDPNPTANGNKGFYGPSLQPLGGIKSIIANGIRTTGSGSPYKTTATLTLFNGCGEALESWIYMNAFPIKIDWGDLDMSSSDVTTVDLSIRFDRAYILGTPGGAPGAGNVAAPGTVGPPKNDLFPQLPVPQF